MRAEKRRNEINAKGETEKGKNKATLRKKEVGGA